MNQIKIALGYSPRQWGDVQVLDAALQRDEQFEVVTAATSAQQLYEDARSFDAHIALLSPLVGGYQPQLIADLLHHDARPIPTIGLIPAMGNYADDMYAAGMKAHASLPLDDAQIRRLVVQIPEVVGQALAERRSDSFVPLTRSELATVKDSGWRKLTLAVWSPKGGVGKTFIATNLAVALGVVGMRKTLLIDADQSRANVHVYLALSTERNLFALYSQVIGRGNGNGPQVTPQILKQNIAHYGTEAGSKLDVLVGIPKMHMAGSEEFRADDDRTRVIFEQIIQGAREYDFRVIDLGPDLNLPLHDAAIREADLVLIVATPELTCLNDLKGVLPALKQAYGSLDRFEVVINKFSDRYGITQADIREELGMKKFGFVPADDETAMLSINTQKPVVLDPKVSPLADGIANVATCFYPGLESIWAHRGGKVNKKYQRETQRKEPGLLSGLKSLLVSD